MKTITPKYTRPLVTGGAGFIGSHLIEALLAKELEVSVIDNLSTGNLSNLPDHPKLNVANLSITDREALEPLFSEADIIFHLAASVGVKQIMENPVSCIQTNVEGTKTVLETALKYGTKIVITSTSEIYGKSTAVPFREDDDAVLGPTSMNRWAYAASKMVSEFLALAYSKEKGLKIVIARLFNTVGPRQTGRYGMVIPRFINQALSGRPLTVFGDGSQQRCFLHVNDAVDALLLLASQPKAEGKVFNIGSMEETSILDLAKKILKLADSTKGHKDLSGSPGHSFEDKIDFIPLDRVYGDGFEDMSRRIPDISRIKAVTGWEPIYNLDGILEDIFQDRQSS